jgi:YVTN family beta-propeller protein
MLKVMSPNSPVWRANVAGLAPLAGGTSAAPALPLTMFGSVRAAARRIRARLPTLAESVVGDTAYDIPLNTPVANPPPAPTSARVLVKVDAFPTAVAVSPRGTQVYVVNTSSDSVSIIDADTRIAAATVGVGRAPYGIALTPDGSTAYVANAGDNSVSIIDTEALRVMATIAVGENPYGVAVTPDGECAYVTNQASGSLSVIGAVKSTIKVGGAPTGVAISPDGQLAYVVDNEAHSLTVVDTATGTTTGVIPVGKHPAQVAITPDGTQAFVTNAAGGSVSVVDLSSTAVTETLMVSDHPIGVAVGPDGRFAYVTALDASLLAGTLTIVDIATGTMETLRAGAPYGVAADPAGHRAYFTDFRSQTVSVIFADDECDEVGADLVGKSIAARRRSPPKDTALSIPIDRGALSVVADPDAGRAFVVRSDDDAIEVIDSSGHCTTVNVGQYPTALVLTRDGARAYVTNYEDGSLSVIDTTPDSDSAYTVAGTLDVGPSWSTGVLLSGDGSRAYAVDEVDGHLSVIDTVADSPSRDTVIAHIELGDPPTALRIAPNRRWVYAINHFDHLLWAVHTATNRMAAIKLPAYPYRIFASPNGSRVYASLCGDGSTCVIDTDPGSARYHRIIGCLRLDGYGPDPVFTTAGAHAYVLNSDTNSVSVIDTATSTVKSIAVGKYPWDVAVSPDGRRAYVVNNLDDTLSILGSATDSVIATVPVGVRPLRVAVSPDGARAFVINSRDDSVSVIDTATSTLSDTIAVGHTPFDVSVSADGGRAFVRHRDGLSLVTAQS